VLDRTVSIEYTIRTRFRDAFDSRHFDRASRCGACRSHASANSSADAFDRRSSSLLMSNTDHYPFRAPERSDRGERGTEMS